MFLTWLNPAQLDAIDRSEGVTSPSGPYDRVLLPAADVPVELESGELLDGAHLYVNRRGVLHNGSGTPHTHPGEHALLIELLAESPRLRELFGSTPEEFCARARGNLALCMRGTRLFAELGWTTASGLEKYVRAQQSGSPGTG